MLHIVTVLHNSMCNDGHLLTLKIMLDRFQFRISKQMFMHLSVTSIEKLLRKKFHCCFR